MKISPFAGRIVIALVVVNAATGVIALIASSGKQLGSFEAHIFLTTLAVSMAAFSVLPCGLALERGGSRLRSYVAAIAIGTALMTLVLLVLLIWTDDPPDDLWRATATSSFVSLGLALIALLSLAHLPSSNEWVRLAAYALTALTSAQLTALVWSDDPGDRSARILFATLILLAASSVLVPILQRMAGKEQPDLAPALRFCPSCGTRLRDTRTSACPECGAVFEVQFP